MGLAVLPARLKSEMAELESLMLSGGDLKANEKTAAHADWAEGWRKNHADINAGNIHDIVRNEIGMVFAKVLECAGVYKCTDDGRAAFKRFTDSI